MFKFNGEKICFIAQFFVITSYYSIIFSVLAPSQYSINESKLKINTINRIVIPKGINLFLIETLDSD